MSLQGFTFLKLVNHSISYLEACILFIAIVRGKIRLYKLTYDPYKVDVNPGKLELFYGTLDDSIDYAELKNVSLLQNADQGPFGDDWKKSALIMQTSTSIDAQSLHKKGITKLAGRSTMAKVDLANCITNTVIIVENTDDGGIISRLVLKPNKLVVEEEDKEELARISDPIVAMSYDPFKLRTGKYY